MLSSARLARAASKAEKVTERSVIYCGESEKERFLGDVCGWIALPGGGERKREEGGYFQRAELLSAARLHPGAPPPPRRLRGQY